MPGDEREHRGKSLRHRVANALDLPKDIVLDLPRMTIIGDLQAVIENHRGVVEYTPEKIVLNMDKGRLEIVGEDLHIGAIYKEEINITGRIGSLSFRR